jgi:16S rRNA G527 N7-methylase RsmG
LVDSIKKKMNAVENILSRLSLTNAEALLGRAEELSKIPACRNGFDYVIARAVGSVYDVVTWSSGFIRKINKSAVVSETEADKLFILPGSIILIKGGDLREEILRLSRIKKDWRIETRSMKVVGLPQEELQDKKFVIVR